MKKHWSRVERLHEAVTNPNIIVKGTHSYYSDCWDDGFEASVVRYLCGDEESQHWELPWKIDQLYIWDYVCIGAEAVILMGGTITILPIGFRSILFWKWWRILINRKEIPSFRMELGLGCAQ